jgi:hypothetical protein
VKNFSVFLAAGMLCMFVLYPEASCAGDEIDVTMQVIDDLDQIDDELSTMPGPWVDAGEDGDDSAADIDDAIAVSDQGQAEFEDDFEHDDVNDVMDEHLAEEGNFEEGEQVDDDKFDTETHQDQP